MVISEAQREANKRFYEAHKEEISRNKKIYYQQNRERLLSSPYRERRAANSRVFYEKNREEINKRRRQRYREQKNQ